MKAAVFAVAVIGGLLGSAPLRAAVITFSGAYPNGQTTIPAAYQPLLNGYASGDSYNGPGTGKAGAAQDGGPLGITVTWDGLSSTSGADFNNGVTDHTGDTAHMVAYDNGNPPPAIDIKFSAPVTVPNLFYAYFNHGATSADQFVGLLAGVPVVTFTQAYPGGAYNWQAVTGFGTTHVDEIQAHAEGGAGNYLQLDDITVNPVPEPASILLAGFAALGLALVAGRRKA